MIVWLNGPIGGGKSQLAAELHQALPGSVVADPEEVGALLRRSLASHPSSKGDYQEYPAWRSLTVRWITELHQYTGGPVIVPMTVLDPLCATELFTPLRGGAAEFHHLVLHAEPAVLQERITADGSCPDDLARGADTCVDRLQRAADYQAAADSWMHAQGHVIDTSTLTTGQTLQLALAHLHTT